MKSVWRFFSLVSLVSLSYVMSTDALAAPFEIAVSPARFELSGKSNTRIGQSLDIHNVGRIGTEVSVRTLDWAYSAEGGITYIDELIPNSCRPWVALERKTVRIAPSSKHNFRFQITVPDNTPAIECRFMLAIEGIEPAYKTIIEGGGANLSLPVSGRIAVAVYMSVNGAESKLSVQHVGVKMVQGKSVPSITVTNTGNAHGRLEGALDTTDANGVIFELVPEGTPIMPGQTRVLTLTQKTEPNREPVNVTYPLKSSGLLDWEKGSFKINAEFK